MNLQDLIGSFGGGDAGGGSDTPETLPSLDMPSSAPLPMAPGGQMPQMPDPRPASGEGHVGGMHIVRDLAPMLLAMVAGIRNPLHGAAIAHGMTQGALRARAETMDQQRHDDQVRQLGVHFMQQTAADVMRLKDPLERQRYLQFAHDIGVQQFKLPADWTTKIPAHNDKEDVFAKLKGELSDKLAAFDKDKKWATVAGTPQEAKISFRLSDGQTVPVNKARQLVGQAVFDESGAQAFAPATEAAGKTEQERAAQLLAGIRTATARGDKAKAAELQATYDDLIKAKADTRADPGSLDGAILDAYRKGDQAEVKRLTALKRSTSDAGRAAPITVNMPGADKVDRAAQAVIAGRMSPSQAVSMFGGMGRDAGAFKREMTLRVLEVDPAFNFQEAESNYQYGKNTGVQASIRYMSSVQDSMPMLLERAKKLNNGQFRSLNALVNAGKNQINDVDLKRFRVDVTLVADEVAKILQGGGTGSATSDAKLKQAGALLNETDDPAAIAGALEDINALIGFRKDAQTKGTYLDKSKGAGAGGEKKARLVYNPVTGKLEPK